MNLIKIPVYLWIFFVFLSGILMVWLVPGEERRLGNDTLDWAAFAVSVVALLVSVVGTVSSIYFQLRSDRREEDKAEGNKD